LYYPTVLVRLPPHPLCYHPRHHLLCNSHHCLEHHH
jgi:hypothetical protein